MKSLQEFLDNADEITIDTLASYIRRYLQEQWQLVLSTNQHELEHIFDTIGEGAAYGTYATKLLQPIQQQLKRADYVSKPRFPGTLSTSREWGPQEERERWMWSVVGRAQEVPIGALAILYCHDHTRFRIPRAPDVLALQQNENTAIVEALSRASIDFERAEE